MHISDIITFTVRTLSLTDVGSSFSNKMFTMEISSVVYLRHHNVVRVVINYNKQNIFCLSNSRD